jgi:hypothetical protein
MWGVGGLYLRLHRQLSGTRRPKVGKRPSSSQRIQRIGADMCSALRFFGITIPAHDHLAAPLSVAASFVASLPTRRAPSVADALRAIVRWITGRQPMVSRSEQQLEQRIVDLLAQELEENEPPVETSLTPLKPKRDRRVR